MLNCSNIAVQYQNSSGDWVLCDGYTNSTSVAQSCPLTTGTNTFNVIAQDIRQNGTYDVITDLQLTNGK